MQQRADLNRGIAMDAWRDFFVAQVGAAAALAGLLIVAMSINIGQILQHAELPARAAQTVAVIGGVLVIASLALFPNQSAQVLGVEAILVSLTVAWVGVHQFMRSGGKIGDGDPSAWRLRPLFMISLVAALFLVGGAILASGSEVGLDVLGLGVIAGLVVALINGWVLLVEILR